jgi:hypothetical protein
MDATQNLLDLLTGVSAPTFPACGHSDLTGSKFAARSADGFIVVSPAMLDLVLDHNLTAQNVFYLKGLTPPFTHPGPPWPVKSPHATSRALKSH